MQQYDVESDDRAQLTSLTHHFLGYLCDKHVHDKDKPTQEDRGVIRFNLIPASVNNTARCMKTRVLGTTNDDGYVSNILE